MEKMEPYTGKDRLLAAARREYADRIPVSIIFGPYCARVAGIQIKDFLTKSHQFAQSTIEAYETVRPDAMPIYMDTLLEAEAIGNELYFPEDSYCLEKSHILEDKSTLAKLNLPDPKSDKRLPVYLEGCERVAAAIEEASISGTINGPWSTAMSLRGVRELIFDTVEDPRFLHELMCFTTGLAKQMGSALLEAGMPRLSMGDASASCSVISPKIYREFVLPYHQEIVGYFRERKVGVTLHVCGYVDPIMEDLVSSGAAALSIDSPSSLKRLVEASQRRVIIVGNVDTSLFAQGAEAEMEEAVKRCIAIAAEGSGYVLSSGCEIPLNSTLDMVRCYIKAAYKYGRYEPIGPG